VIRNSRFHRRRNAKCFVNPAEVVIPKPEAERGPVVLPLFAEAVREPSEPADAHSHAEVLAFYVGRADAFRVGVAHNWDHLRTDNFGGGIAGFALNGCTIHLDELGEIHTVAERVVDSGTKGTEAVRRDLKILRRRGVPESFD